jgi:hypothetical protein
MASFEEILNRPASENKPPPAYPAGTYHCLIDGLPEHGKSNNGNDFFRYKFKILALGPDVDPKEAAEQQVVGKTFTNDYYVTDAATWRLTEFLSNLGLDTKTSLKPLINESPGQQVMVTLRHESSPDGKRVFHRVHSTAHV